MKKVLLLLTLLFAVVSFANEVKAQIKPEFGIRAGVNFASWAGAPVLGDISPRVGLLVGVYGRIPIPGSSFSIQPEVLYTQKGIRINNFEVHLNYIQIPVFARVDFANQTLLSPHLILGPYLTFKLNNVENPSIYNNVLYGLAVGAGVDINRISIGIRYSHDIKNFHQGTVEGKNYAISIVAGFRF